MVHFFSSEIKSVNAESCLEIYNKTSKNDERENFLGFSIDQDGNYYIDPNNNYCFNTSKLSNITIK